MRRYGRRWTHTHRFLLRRKGRQLLKRLGQMNTDLLRVQSLGGGSLVCTVLHRISHRHPRSKPDLCVLARKRLIVGPLSTKPPTSYPCDDPT